MVPVALNVRVKCGAAAAAESCDRVERVMMMAESRKLCGELEGGSEIGLLQKRRRTDGGCASGVFSAPSVPRFLPRHSRAPLDNNMDPLLSFRVGLRPLICYGHAPHRFITPNAHVL